jgi:hypothetical protein
MMTASIVLVLLLTLTAMALVFALVKLRDAKAVHAALQRTHAEQMRRFLPIVDIEKERERVGNELEVWRSTSAAEVAADRARFEQERQRLSAESASERAQAQAASLSARSEVQALAAGIERLRQEFSALDEESNLQSFGFYKPRYSFADSGQYQGKLDVNREQQKQQLKGKTAATCSIEWTVNGSKSEGKKQINQTLKLMLRAFNGECDAAIAKVKYNNVHVMEARIQKACEVINGLAEVQSCRISRDYLQLKLQELYLVHEYEEKLQAEKEEQRRIREQMREEEVALREIEKARQDAEKEEVRYADALRKAREEMERASGSKQQRLIAQVEELQRKLTEAHANKERALSRAQMTRSGHVYIISNIGSFGEQVYKIGMTRRLDPLDRVKELGDASVPFEFDVHAILYTEDAPALENKLHRAFHHRRVNRVNAKKEFFRVELTEIVEFVRVHHRADIEIVHAAEAEEYRKTVALLQQDPGARSVA